MSSTQMEITPLTSLRITANVMIALKRSEKSSRQRQFFWHVYGVTIKFWECLPPSQVT